MRKTRKFTSQAYVQRQLGRHLALLDPKTSIYKQMTEGDAIDAHPMWSKAVPQTIVYDSCGIGFDQEGRESHMVQKKHNNECLIEGHLINVEENEKRHVSQGERYAGIMPRNIIYSNGKYVIRLLPDGKEEKLAEVPLATNLCCME